MADIGIYTKNADIQARAGSKANATAKATAATDVYVLDVESFINASTMYNWSDAYAALNADVKYILKETGACMCAIYVIQYDMSGYTSRAEAELMINILWDIFNRNLNTLKEIKIRDFIVGA